MVSEANLSYFRAVAIEGMRSMPVASCRCADVLLSPKCWQILWLDWSRVVLVWLVLHTSRDSWGGALKYNLVAKQIISGNKWYKYKFLAEL